ncbi:MAG: chromate efflux transporter [Dehalococcoidia bacterium]|nr:chromate efflux transporter [Dehalococcoidia bacterium]
MAPTEPARASGAPAPRIEAAWEVFRVALRLGLTSFGGPVAHLGYFRAEYVERRRWLDEAAYADLVALCQFLPGPASSQVGIGVGMLRAGLLGGVAAWVGFTLPSALALALFALGLRAFDVADAGWLHGLKIVAVAVVAQAVWGMARSLAPDRPRATIAILAALAVLASQTALAQVAAIAVAGVIGWRLLDAGDAAVGGGSLRVAVPRWVASVAWVLFFGLLVALPLARRAVEAPALALFDSFYRAGALVFGGGHVVLPLLQAEVVPGLLTQDAFIAGYGAAQAVPGPLFTFAAYLGAASSTTPNGWAGAAVALLAIFLPSFLLMAGALPLWDALRRRGAFQAALRGVNAAVVGILGAALYTPVWTSAIGAPPDFALALVAFGALQVLRLPPSLVVVGAALGGQAIALL